MRNSAYVSVLCFPKHLKWPNSFKLMHAPKFTKKKKRNEYKTFCALCGDLLPYLEMLLCGRRVDAAHAHVGVDCCFVCERFPFFLSVEVVHTHTHTHTPPHVEKKKHTGRKEVMFSVAFVSFLSFSSLDLIPSAALFLCRSPLIMSTIVVCTHGAPSNSTVENERRRKEVRKCVYTRRRHATQTSSFTRCGERRGV